MDIMKAIGKWHLNAGSSRVAACTGKRGHVPTIRSLEFVDCKRCHRAAARAVASLLKVVR